MAMVSGVRHRAAHGVVVAAGVALLLGWSLLPIYWIVVTSFKVEGEIYQLPPTLVPHAPTLGNYATVLFKTRFPIFVRNSAIVAIATTLMAVAIGTLASYAITRISFRGRATVARAVVASYLLPPALLFIPLFIVLQRLGLIDTLMGLSLSYLTFTVPFATWMLIGYFRTIPSDLDEAARIDGAGRVQVLLRVIAPIAAPGIAVVALFTFTQSWNEFLYALIYVYSDAVRTLTSGLVGMMMGDVFIWGQLMAASVIAILPVLAIYVVAQRYLVEGLSSGSVKT
ncbi:MAG: carbohydrate ABC transporter permease [Acidisphaera sp.]|nr:carbohydrate ABC transporter permease [Acidisphaera sp.]MBV9811934.1 carbohydrate ABC transporter permease [Acetobacteraceae bacterium]